MFVPIYNKENSIERIFCLATDITGQQNTESELEKMKKQLKDNATENTTLKQTIKRRELEIDELNKDISDLRQQNVDYKSKLDKAAASAQFFKRELEKRISKFRKIETSLKDKVKNLEGQLGIVKDKPNNAAINNNSSTTETKKD